MTIIGYLVELDKDIIGATRSIEEAMRIACEFGGKVYKVTTTCSDMNDAVTVKEEVL